MKENIVPAVKLTLLCLIFFSGIYSFAIWGVAQLAPNQGRGETIVHNENTYYVNVGQAFTADRYFNSRPSAVGYNAAGSGGSNKGPSNPAYLADVQARIDTFLVHNPGAQKSEIPADLVTAGGSGLDPHISVQAARVQVPRIAALRRLAATDLEQLIVQHTERPLLGLFGTERVHVLKLNLALDELR